MASGIERNGPPPHDGYVEVGPPFPHRDLVRALWQNDGGAETLVLPDGCTDLLFVEGEAPRVVGVMSRALRVPSSGRRALGVRLQPWAAQAVLGAPAGALRDATIPLADVSPDLARALQGVSSLPELVRELESQRWRSAANGTPSPRVMHAAQLLETLGDAEIRGIAADADITERQLRRLFVAHVGLSPKRFARVMRLQRAVGAMHGEVRLSAVAARAGFADQAHLCRETRSLAGVTTSELLRQRLTGQ